MTFLDIHKLREQEEKDILESERKKKKIKNGNYLSKIEILYWKIKNRISQWLYFKTKGKVGKCYVSNF